MKSYLRIQTFACIQTETFDKVLSLYFSNKILLLKMKLLLFVLFISCAVAQPNFWPFNYGQHNDHDEHNDSKCPALKEANNNDFENVCSYYDVM